MTLLVSPANRLRNAGEYYFARKAEGLRQLRARGLDVINLGIGSPDLTPPHAVIESTVRSLQSETSHGYAPYRSTPELRKAMAEFYGRAYRVQLDPERHVLPLLGSKEGILGVSLAFLNPGDGVLVPNPGYPAYSSVASLVGANPRPYDLSAESGWWPDFEALERTDLSGCKLMWVNYPHMPTGTAGSRDLFERLVDFGRRKRILICHDNPYGLVLNRDAPLSILSSDPSFDVSLELNSLSKSFNMAGWRVGMCLGSEEVVNAVLQVKSNIDSGMFLSVQAGAVTALSSSDDWLDARNAIYARRRELVWRLFDLLGFTCDANQVGLFVWAKAPDSLSDVEAFLNALLESAHVCLTPGFVFGTNGLRYARASLCVSEVRLEEALQRVERFKSDWGRA